MDEVKRLNYFNSQFLIDKDFNDEQAYHRNLRYLRNRLANSWGIATGLQINPVIGNPRQLSITPGVAIDSQGREIILPDNPAPASIDLTPAGAVTSITVAIAYQDFLDPADIYRDNKNYVRISERPKILIFGSATNQVITERLEFRTGNAPTDGSVVPLANVTIQSGGVSIDPSGRKSITAVIAPGAIDASKIAPSTITTDRIAPNAIDVTRLADGAVTNTKLAAAVQAQINAPILSLNNVTPDATRNINLVANNAIVVTPDSTNKNITIGESHSSRTDNPHQTTAAQIDTQGGTNRIVTQINAGTGTINAPRVDTAIARVADVNARFDPATGHNHDGANSRKIAPTNLEGVGATVSATNLNTLTAASGSDASSLHFHATIPTQTGTYHIPMAPLKNGTSPEFVSTITNITAPSGIQAVGRIPLLLPNGAQLTQFTIDTSTTVATGNTFNLSVQIQLVPSVTGGAITNIFTNPISVSAPSTRSVQLNHSVTNFTGTYWLVLTMLTPASAATGMVITGLFINYTLNRLF